MYCLSDLDLDDAFKVSVWLCGFDGFQQFQRLENRCCRSSKLSGLMQIRQRSKEQLYDLNSWKLL